jgi:FkbM family methyltransferase
MIQFDKWMLPPGEEHLQGWMLKVNKRVEGRLTYQYHKYEAALQFCKTRDVCIDAGAHVGLMSYWMARDFAQLVAFEPVAIHRECWQVNMKNRSGNVQLHDCALGERPAQISIHTEPTSSGDSRVGGPGAIPMKRLDDFDLQDVSFIKIDTEGFETFVIRGAEQTIRRCKPCLMVEQKPGHAQRFGVGEKDAIPLLESWGAKVRKIMSGDYILSWG